MVKQHSNKYQSGHSHLASLTPRWLQTCQPIDGHQNLTSDTFFLRQPDLTKTITTATTPRRNGAENPSASGAVRFIMEIDRSRRASGTDAEGLSGVLCSVCDISIFRRGPGMGSICYRQLIFHGQAGTGEKRWWHGLRAPLGQRAESTGASVGEKGWEWKTMDREVWL